MWRHSIIIDGLRKAAHASHVCGCTRAVGHAAGLHTSTIGACKTSQEAKQSLPAALPAHRHNAFWSNPWASAHGPQHLNIHQQPCEWSRHTVSSSSSSSSSRAITTTSSRSISFSSSSSSIRDPCENQDHRVLHPGHRISPEDDSDLEEYIRQLSEVTASAGLGDTLSNHSSDEVLTRLNPGTDRLQRLRFRRRQPSFEVSILGYCQEQRFT